MIDSRKVVIPDNTKLQLELRYLEEKKFIKYFSK